MQADIIMLAWNHLDLTRRAIDSVRECTTVPYQLIVVDNGSEDGTGEWLAQQEDIVVISNDENRGFAPGANQGLAVSKAPYVVLMNNDVEVDMGWLKLLIEGLEENPRVGAISPLATAKQTEWEGRYRGQSGVQIVDYYLAYYCTVFRQEVFQEVGVMDEQFAPAYGEDNDHGLRMRKAGWDQAVHCDVVVYHKHGATTGPAGQAKYGPISAQQLREKWPGENF